MIVNGLRDRSTWEEIPFEVIGEAFGALAIESWLSEEFYARGQWHLLKLTR